MEQYKNQMIDLLLAEGWGEEEIQEDVDVEEAHLILSDSGFPLMYVGFTEDIRIEKNYSIKELIDIHNFYNVQFIALTNGVESSIHSICFGFFDPVEETNIYTFLKEWFNEYGHLDIFRRREDYELSTTPLIDKLLVDCYILSDVTPEKHRKRLIEFVNALYYETYEPTDRDLPIEIVEDHQLEFYKSSNASGGAYDGLHRVFAVKLEDGTIVPFMISVVANAQTSNDPIYKNRNGGTQLNIAMVDKPNTPYNLQLNLDKYILFDEKNYHIWHNGVRSRLKSEYVLNMVHKHAPFLLKDNKVQLGKFKQDSTISREEFSLFIENLVSYSYCRKLADLQYR